jgi:hypothetical protein
MICSSFMGLKFGEFEGKSGEDVSQVFELGVGHGLMSFH